jgi:hypothetical protein
MANETYSYISGSVIGSSTNTYTFSSIPAGYTDLKIIVCARGSGGGDSLLVTVNSTNVTYYNDLQEYDGVSYAASYYAGSNAAFYGGMAFGGTQAANMFSQAEINIGNYASSVHKPISSMQGNTNNIVTSQSMSFGGGQAGVSVPITSITLTASGSTNFLATSSFMLYGIKKF